MFLVSLMRFTVGAMLIFCVVWLEFLLVFAGFSAGDVGMNYSIVGLRA